MTVTHLKKKDIVKSSVKGVAVEFDHEKLASILGIPGNNGICEYVKDVWEESKYIKPLEITRRESWMNDNGLNNMMDLIKRQKWEKLFKRRELVHVDAVKEFYARLTMSHNRKKDVARSSVRGVEIKFDHMKLASILGIPGNNDICEYIKEVWEESRTRDDEIEAPAEEAEEEVEAQNSGFDWEVMVDEATVQGESGSDDLFFDAQVDVEEPVIEAPAAPAFPASPGDSTT
ncbi:hypothetical protein Dimus_020632 [Dionaea muscipula]